MLAGWRERSPFVDRQGPIDFYHYDFRAQALSKLARGFDRDLADVRAMLERGLVGRADIASGLDEILPRLVRYPSLDTTALERRVRRFLEEEVDLTGLPAADRVRQGLDDLARAAEPCRPSGSPRRPCASGRWGYRSKGRPARGTPRSTCIDCSPRRTRTLTRHSTLYGET